MEEEHQVEVWGKDFWILKIYCIQLQNIQLSGSIKTKKKTDNNMCCVEEKQCAFWWLFTDMDRGCSRLYPPRDFISFLPPIVKFLFYSRSNEERSEDIFRGFQFSKRSLLHSSKIYPPWNFEAPSRLIVHTNYTQ